MNMWKNWVKYSLVLQMAVAGVTLAQMNTDTNTQGNRTGTSDNAGAVDTNRDHSLTHDTNQASGTVRASKLIGTDVRSSRDGKSLGDIKDLVLDRSDKKVGYVVISSGGIAGLGDKYFAVPYKMVQYGGAGNHPKAMVNLDEQTLKNAPGFNKDQWPSEANAAEYYQKLDQYYSQQGNVPGGTAAAGNAGQRAMPAGAQVDTTGPQWTRRASVLIGAKVDSPDGSRLGTVRDLVLDWRSGDVKYAVLEYGGILGMGDKLFAVPIDQFKAQPNSDSLVLNASKDQLKNAPGFNKDQWPDMANPNWDQNISNFYKNQGSSGSDMNR